MTVTEAQRTGYELTEAEMLAIGKHIAKDYMAARAAVLESLQKFYGKYLVDVDPADYYTVLNEYNRLQKLQKEIQGIYVKSSVSIVDKVKKSQVLAFVNNFYRQSYVTTLAISDIGKATGFIPVLPAAIEASVYSDLTLWKGIRDEALKRAATGLPASSGITLSELLKENTRKHLVTLSRTIRSSLITGDSYAKAAKKVRNSFDISATNIMRILRTEGNRNLNAAAYWNSVEYQNRGITIDRKWLATLDANTRETHQRLDGQKAGKDDKFTIDGMNTKYPGQFGIASEDINCRCSTVDVVDGVDPDLRRAKDPLTGKTDIIDYKNYNEWMKNNGYRQDKFGKWIKSSK